MNAGHLTAVMRHPVVDRESWVATCLKCDWEFESTSLWDVVREMDEHSGRFQ